jgi:hypothetical protein
MTAREHAENLYEWLLRRGLIKPGAGPRAHALHGIEGMIQTAMDEARERGRETFFANPEG